MMLFPMLTTAAEHTWWFVGDNDDSVVYVYDDISLTSYGEYKAWVKWVYKSEALQKKYGATETKYLVQYSSDLTECRHLSMIDYDAEGNVVKSINCNSDIQYIVPETIGAEIARTVHRILDMINNR